MSIAATSLTIRPATSWDTRPIAGVLTTAAVTAAQWTASARVGRALLLYDALLKQTGHAVRNGAALLAEHDNEAIGALIWSSCPPTDADIGTPAPADGFEAPGCLLAGPLGPPQQPHWDLRAFGVLPGHRRRGVGTALLDAWHRQPHHLPVARAAVAVTGHSRLLSDHGYRFIGAIRPTGWEDGPVMQRLWRPAVPTTATSDSATTERRARRC
ncbi:GNAT family N-acetyltransferase [Actinoplanes sp. HUAS TT8]|uniref:GNAT family N-acetyltransferase n=1 Tax=Actinoplanes sp. HUAS TT8 TaxID=3447453 RepID=UPI003F52480A